MGRVTNPSGHKPYLVLWDGEKGSWQIKLGLPDSKTIQSYDRKDIAVGQAEALAENHHRPGVLVYRKSDFRIEKGVEKVWGTPHRFIPNDGYWKSRQWMTLQYDYLGAT